MPGMSGPEVVAALRAEHGPLPVLLTSGAPADDDAATAVLPKPFTPETVLRAVREALHGDVRPPG
jgi:CheY-like chemotaxis protein